jgi:hypothetical protein
MRRVPVVGFFWLRVLWRRQMMIRRNLVGAWPVTMLLALVAGCSDDGGGDSDGSDVSIPDGSGTDGGIDIPDSDNDTFVPDADADAGPNDDTDTETPDSGDVGDGSGDDPDADADADGDASDGDGSGDDASTDGSSDVTTPEVCTDAVDNDGDELVDCDDPDCVSDPECEVDTCGDGVRDEGEECDQGPGNGNAPDACRSSCENPGCGDGVVDSGETCDDGDDNDDRLANACRTTCQPASCGDGTRDDGEQCDDGRLNAAGSACEPGCIVNLEVACEDVDVVELSDVATEFPGGLRVDFSIVGFDSAWTVPAGCSDSGDRADGAEEVFVWLPEEDGTWRISTANALTATNTVIYIQDSCTGGRPLGCNDNARAGTRGSELLFDAVAGSAYFIVVDSIGVTGPVTLELTEITETLGGEGDVCETGLDCDAGLECGFGVCVADTAPVIETVTARYVTATETLLLLVEGTDADGDVVDIEFPRIAFDDGSDVVNIVLTNPPDVVADGTDYVLDLSITGVSVLSASETASPTELTVEIVDALGQTSAPRTVAVTVVETPTEVTDGADCDADLADPVCAEGLFCGLQPDGTNICGPSVAPEIVSATGYWATSTTVVLEFTVRDLDRDFLDGSIALQAAQNTAGANVPVTAEDWEVTDFRARDVLFDVTLTWTIGARLPASVEALFIDGAENEASQRVTFGARPAGVAAGQPCGRGILCAGTNVCSPTPQGTEVCLASQDPFITGFEAFYDDETRTSMTVEFTAADPNGDIFLVGFFLYGDLPNGSIDFEELDLIAFDEAAFPGMTGALTYSGTLSGIPIDPLTTRVGAVLLDFDDNLSVQIVDALAPEGGRGQACTTTSAAPCRNDLVCGPGSTCIDPTAPVLESVVVERIDIDTFVVRATGSDVDADVSGVRVFVFQQDGTPLPGAGGQIGGTLLPNPSVLGQSTFTANTEFTVNGVTDNAEFGSLSVRLVDFVGLESDELTPTIPLVVGPGSACSPTNPELGACGSNTECVGGVCDTVAPSLGTVTVARNTTNPARAIASFSGSYRFADITGYVMTYPGPGLPDRLEAGAFATGSRAVVTPGASAGTFAGTIEFSFNRYADLGYDTLALSVLNAASDESNTRSVSLPIVVDFGEACSDDPEEICVAGTTCEPADPVSICLEDLEVPCGPLLTPALLSALTLNPTTGAYTGTVRLLTQFETNTDVCDTAPVTGQEAAILLPASATGLTVRVSSAAFRPVVFLRGNNACANPAETLRCADSTAGSPNVWESTLDASVTDGSVWLVVDGNGNRNQPFNLTITPVADPP